MMLANRTSFLLIDLDGTLMDTLPDLAEAANRMRQDFGLAALPPERIASFVGKGADVLIHRALLDDLEGRLEPAFLGRGRTSFFRHYHELNGTKTVVYEGIPEALELLHGAGIRLACVTNKPREFTLPLLERLRLAEWFSVVVSGDEVEEPKPHPALLLLACDRLGAEPCDGVMVGDSVNDALAARAAGMRVVLVETGYNEGEPVSLLRGQPGVEAVVPGLLEVARHVLGGVRR